MSDKTNEWLEREAREALVAADLSAKMKQWRQETPPRRRGGRPVLFVLLLLLFLGAAAWWFWPDAAVEMPPLRFPSEQQTPVQKQPAPALPEQRQQEPVVLKPAGNRYVALAQTHYQSPDFAADIRGDAPAGQDMLDDARQALAAKQPAAALAALQTVPAAYQTDADYLRGHALFAQKKYPQAAAVFGRLTGSVRYGEAAEWYETLALLPGFDRNKSLIMNRLEKISGDDEHIFQREAKRLAEQLKI